MDARAHTMKSLVNFIVYSNIFIGLCALALTWETFVLLALPSSLNWYLLLIFLCTVFIYSLHYYVKSSRNKTDSRLDWCRRNKKLLIVILIASFIFITGGVVYHYKAIFGPPGSFNYRNLAWFIAIPVLALAYSHPLTPWNKKTLREIGWLKMASLSFIWSFTTVGLPLFMLSGNTERSVTNYQLIVLFMNRFFFIAALSFLFNINDYQEDRKDGIKTLAVMIGPEKSLALGKILMPLINIAAAALLVHAFSLYAPLTILAIAVPIFLLWFLYYRFYASKDEANFVVRHDGLMIVKALLLIFALLFYSR
jgi:4-hydroxybenzoate polyprenyltransferase